MYSKPALSLSREVEDIVVADVALTVAFALVFSTTGLASYPSKIDQLLFFLPIAFVAVTLSFVLHELMHKFVAQHFGAAAAFRRSDTGILITLAVSFYTFIAGSGFLIGIPGATMIYSSQFTKKQEGYVSLAGPLTNFAVFAIFFLLFMILSPDPKSFFGIMISITMLISLILAFFNMLPIYPLDGSKVLRWNMPIYFSFMAVLFGLLYYVEGVGIVVSLAIFLVIALLFSSFYKMVLF